MLLVIFFSFETFGATAMNTGFLTNQLTEQEKSTFISNIELSFLTNEPIKRSIECFDVNENETIAIGQNGNSTKKIVCVYSNNGVFQYGYTFKSSGTFGVEWSGDNINIYFIRSDVIVSVTPDGEISDIAEVENTTDNNSYLNNFIFSNRRMVGDTEYIIKNKPGIFNIFASSYSMLISKNKNAEEHILYDVNSTQNLITLLRFITIVLFISIVIFIVIKQFKVTKRRQGSRPRVS